MSTSPDQPDNADLPIEKQLDELLVQIEEAEPGVIDPAVLPAAERTRAELAREEAASASVEPPPENADQPTDSEINELLNEPPTAEKTPEQAEMLAALNTALQGISGDAPADESSDPDTSPADPAEELSMEDKLQQEIAALMNAEPQVDAAAPAADREDSSVPSTEDQIAMEIEGLLNEGQDAAATDAEPEAAIDELDKMLANEIDAEDNLAGEFQTVEDVTAGIQVEVPTDPSADDEHAATARDVAEELDSQPEDLPSAPPEPVAATEPEEDPFAVLAEIAETAEVSEADYQQQLTRQQNKYADWLETAKDRLYRFCYLVNWPARRLSAEWRANLGYIALLNLFFGVGLWIVLILF